MRDTTPIQQRPLNSVVVFDRDGVLNVDTPTRYCAKWEDWKWAPYARQALKEIKELGFCTAIATNQNGAADGRYTKDDYKKLMRQARQDLAEYHGTDEYWPDVVAACFHTPHDGCQCRKPRTRMWAGLIEPALRPVAVDRSWMVGDRSSDLEFGRNVGLSSVLIGLHFPTLREFVEYLESLDYGCPWLMNKGHQRCCK